MENIVISIAAPKGGVAKTTTAVNVAAGLALKKKKTLIIDADPSGYSSSAFGFNEEKIFGTTLDIYRHTQNVDDVIHKTQIPYLEMIPFERMDHNDEAVFNSLSHDKFVFNNAIKKIKNLYDYIIIDCPPVLYGSTVNSLIASDYLVIPVKASKFSLDSVSKIQKLVEDINKKENPNLKIDGLILTMYEQNTKASFHIKKELFIQYPNLMFKTTIPKNTSVAESTFYNKPVILFDANASASKAYLNFVDELIDKHETFNLMKLSGFDLDDFNDDSKETDSLDKEKNPISLF
jgi:chromosome partitioning protein